MKYGKLRYAPRAGCIRPGNRRLPEHSDLFEATGSGAVDAQLDTGCVSTA
jgi:hypothetical protein